MADGMGGHAAGEGIVAFVEATQTRSPDQTWPIPFDPEESVNTNRLRAGFRPRSGTGTAMWASKRRELRPNLCLDLNLLGP